MGSSLLGDRRGFCLISGPGGRAAIRSESRGARICAISPSSVNAKLLSLGKRTYKLSTPEIDGLLGAELFGLKIPGVLTARRGLYGTGRVQDALKAQFPRRVGETAEDCVARRQDMVDVLQLWQSGRPMTAGLHIKPIVPPPPCSGVWEFRASRRPPGARLIGVLVERNIFVATALMPRDTLGNRGSPAWNRSINFAAARGQSWFGGQLVQWTEAREFQKGDMRIVCDDL